MTDEELQALNEARQCAIAMRNVLKEAGLERAFSHRFYELFDRAKRDARDVFCGTCNKHFEPERGTGIYVSENGEFVCPSCRREEIVTNANG